ncbi:MAG TPA: biotin-dependent carboxyltransferase family protein, partial [Gemmatimonadaceae bacterium]|nr:biotin-dependent carboxyltransferase family protein [Gemmatimonadaceae bacterium]
MDLPALRTLNCLLGNDENAAAIEWALSGGEIEVRGRVTFVIGGAAASITLNGSRIDSYRVTSAAAGDVIAIDGISTGRFLYLAFGGGVDVPIVMGSRSTYGPGAFGGLDGRRLRSGDTLSLLKSSRRRRLHVTSNLPESLSPLGKREVIRFIPRDSGNALDGEWTISPASDRTGYRLGGRTLDGGASITSEPVCPGVIQLPPGGEPIVLMADAPTVGGYRILGAVITPDLGAFAQLAPGERISFEPVSVDVAQREIATDAARLDRIREWSLS